MTELLTHWTCPADGPNLIEAAVEQHPEPERVRRLMGMGAVQVFAWGNEEGDEGDITAMIKPLVPLELAEAHGLARLPNRVQMRPQG